MIKAIEEMAELTKVISKRFCGGTATVDELIDEIARLCRDYPVTDSPG